MAVDPISLAVTVALTAAQMAMTASQHYEGPRVTDLNASVADYGTPLNYFYGKRWLTCPCPYAEDIRERKKKRKTKGGKFTEYTYFGTWVAHIADHPIGRVTRIKFDGHLVYDVNAEEPLFELDEDYELADAVRFYTGAADQMPDPRVEASIEAEFGPGTCPAWRGQSYIVFEDIPLEKLGNRLPIVTVEAETTSAPAFLTLDFENGVYTLQGQAVELSDVVEASPEDGGSFTESDVVDGVGWVTEVGEWNSAIRLKAGAFGDAPLTGSVTFEVNRDGVAEPANGGGISVFADGPMGSRAASAYVLGPSHGVPSGIDTFYRYDVTSTFGPNIIGTLVADTEYALEFDFPPGSATATIGSDTTSASGTSFEATRLVFDSYRSGIGDVHSGYTIVKKIELHSADAGTDTGAGTSLSSILADLSQRAGLSPEDYDYSALDAITVDGFNWTQGSVKQIAAPLMDVYDFDVRPHDFVVQALPRGGASQGTITDFAKAEPRHTLTVTADSDLPRRVFFNFADLDADQQSNTAVSQRRVGETDSSRELSIDVSTLALIPTDARRYSDRFLRRQWFGRTTATNALTRQHLGIEPGDVWTPTFDGLPVTMVCTKVTIGADGTMPMEWRADVPGLATTTAQPGAPAAGIPPATIYAVSDTAGGVLDLPLLIDQHDQTAPIAYVVAGPVDPAKSWPGADIAQSDTGEVHSFATDWDAIGSTYASEIGTVTGALPAALPWVVDNGSTVEVVLNAGELVSTTDAALIEDGTLNLALIGDELVQFRTATLTAPYTYTLSGFLRGRRGTERAMAGHVAGERFVLLGAAKKHTLGASEIGDTDHYIAHTLGKAAKVDNAFAVAFTGASHRPYAPVNPVVTQAGADWTIDATRRTRVGGATLNGQDVPLGETSEAWEADILDGATVVRTLTGTSLPLTYAEADQVADFGAPLSEAPTGRLYQMNPALNLRGYALTF